MPISKQELRQFIRYRLKQDVEADPRFRRGISEATLQAIVYDLLSRLVGESWDVACGASVPGTSYRSDIALYKLARDRDTDPRFGAVAFEIKAHGQLTLLSQDLRKLSRYLRGVYSDVSFGALVYMSPQADGEDHLRRRANGLERRLAIIRLHPR